MPYKTFTVVATGPVTCNGKPATITRRSLDAMTACRYAEIIHDELAAAVPKAMTGGSAKDLHAACRRALRVTRLLVEELEKAVKP